MSESRRTLTLTKAWDGHKKGGELKVLLPDENPAPGYVDAGRADTLVALGIAVEPGAAPAPSTAPPAEEKE